MTDFFSPDHNLLSPWDEEIEYRPRSEAELLFWEEPVPLHVFIQDKGYLGADWMLSPLQYDLVRVIERVYLQETFVAMRTWFGGYWADPIPMKNLITAQWGKGGGKDSTVRIAAMRVAYLLMCMRSPQRYFGMPEDDSIHILNIAANAPQAHRAFFEPLTRMVKKGWFANRAQPKRDTIEYDKNITAISGHSDAESQEGLNIILGIADEIDAFKAKGEMVGQGNKAREASTSAESILNMIKSSASAQPLDARVLTPTGWVKMGDLQVGDPVVDPMGDRTSVVTGIFPQGVTPVYEVELGDGSVTRASHHHLWEVEYRTIPTTVAERKLFRGQRIVRDTVTTEWLVEALPRFKKRCWPIRVVSSNLHCCDFQGAPLPVDPYLLGTLLGDGGLTHYSPTLTSADPQIFDLVAPLLPPGVEISSPILHQGCESRRFIFGKGRKNPLTEALRNLDLWGRHSYDKFIPEEYFWASASDRLALLQGIMDTDGTADKVGGTISTTSERLARDVRTLAKSLGFSTRVWSFAPPKRSGWVGADGRTIQGRRQFWKVSVTQPGHVTESLFRLDRKVVKSGGRLKSRYDTKIVSVTRIPDDVTQCIKVSAESELYVTDDYIVTHNTRFPENYKRVAISYPRYLGSTIQRLTKEAKDDIAEVGDENSIYFASGPYATWEVNPRISGPNAYASDYRKDPEEAAAKYECKPFRATDTYFRNPEIFAQSIDSEAQPISVDYQVSEWVSPVTQLPVRLWEPVFTFAESFRPVAGARYAMHGDLAVRGDRAGISMSHVAKWVERTESRTDDSGYVSEHVTTAPFLKNDFTISFTSDIGAVDPQTGEKLAREIQIRWARMLAFELIKRGFWIGSFSFDGFQSTDSMQILESHGIESGRRSTDKDPDIWKTLKDVASDGRLRMPRSQLLLEELQALSRVNGKVDHPVWGSKDEADALACSIVGAIELGGSEDATGEPIDSGSIFMSGEEIAPLEFPRGGFDLPFGMKGMRIGAQ